MAALAISAFLCVPAQAQDETRHEVSISYGVVPNSIWLDILDDVLSDVVGMKYERDGYVGPIALEYFYHTTPLVGVGAIATFVNDKKKGHNNDQITSQAVNSNFTIMPAVKFNWLRRANWGVYSKVAAGATFRHFSEDFNNNGNKNTLTDNKVLFNFQVSALGIETGIKNVVGYAELGIGEQGIGLVGIRYKF